MSKVASSGKSKKDKGLTRIGVLVSFEQRDWLQARSEATHIPLTALVRLAIEAYRASVGKPAKTKRIKPAAKISPASEPLNSIDRPGPRADAEEALGKFGA